MEAGSSDGGDPHQQALTVLLNFALQQPDSGVILSIVAVFLLFVASALISGSEVAYFSLSASDINQLNDDHPDRSDRILNLLSRPRYLLATILIANNLVNVAIVVISYFIFTSIIDFELYPVIGYLTNVVGLTFFLVLFGEVLPKIYATKYNLGLAMFMAAPLALLRTAFQPLSKLLVTSSRYIERRIQSNANGDFDPDELEQAIDITTGNRSTEDEIKMLKGIVKFGNIQVKQIMRSRMDMTAVEEQTSFDDLLEVIREAGYSRIPVYQESVDSIKGILYVKDLLEFLGSNGQFRWQDLIRPVHFVPETKKIDDLLKEMQEMRVHLVVAVDEYGGTAGLITLEDILEEVIGEIKDEYDAMDELEYQKLDANNYVFEGKTLITDMCKVLNIKEDLFDDVRGDADSLAGLILEMSGRIPEPGESVLHNNYQFTVVSLGANRIEKIKVTIHETVSHDQ